LVELFGDLNPDDGREPIPTRGLVNDTTLSRTEVHKDISRAHVPLPQRSGQMAPARWPICTTIGLRVDALGPGPAVGVHPALEHDRAHGTLDRPIDHADLPLEEPQRALYHVYRRAHRRHCITTRESAGRG